MDIKNINSNTKKSHVKLRTIENWETELKTWFIPSYNNNVGRLFLEIVKIHFPSGNNLHKILNINNIKLGYSCMDNLDKIINKKP